MELTWWWVVVLACVALAAVIVAALGVRAGRPRRTRPLANVERLARLPAYIRAVRRRRVRTGATLLLLAVALGGAVVAAARPVGLPGPSRGAATAQPEDVMVCLGAPDAAALRYFAARTAGADGTQRIGLTTTDRRVIPLTRDHQYAATRFADYARSADTSTVRYSDYSPTVEDSLALCITGFPSFDRREPQRRSVVYVGPGGRPDARPLFDVAAVRAMAAAAGVQINAVATDADDGVLPGLAHDTGGRYLAPTADVAAALDEIRAHPPQPTTADTEARMTTPETPELPLMLAVGAIGALLALSVLVRAGGRTSPGRSAGLALAAALLVVAVVRPVLGESPRTVPAGVADGEPNVFLVIDRSPGMPASAYADVAAVLDRWPDARIALIGFASTAVLDWPLSQDNWTLGTELQAMRPYPPSPSTLDRANPAAASTLLRYQLIAAHQQFPRARNLVFYYGSGVLGPDSPPRDFNLAEGSVDGGAVFGYGDRTAALSAIAGQLGVPYVRAGTGIGLDGADTPPAAAEPPAAVSAGATETYWASALLAAALILAEVYLVLRGIGRSRPAPLRDPT